MSRETAFYAQSFRLDGSRIVSDRLERFRSAEIAVAAAERMSAVRAGAVALAVTGDNETADYDEPVELFRTGAVPDAA